MGSFVVSSVELDLFVCGVRVQKPIHKSKSGGRYLAGSPGKISRQNTLCLYG